MAQFGAVIFRGTLLAAALAPPVLAAAEDVALDLPWRSPARFRLLLSVDPRGVSRSFTPVSIKIDPADLAGAAGAAGAASLPGRLDEHTIEVMAFDAHGTPAVYDPSARGYERHLLPFRLERLYPLERFTLHFVVPDEKHTRVAVYIDTVESRTGDPRRYPGLVGDGDFFREAYGKRPSGATHFDAFADLDGDGDLDLFRGGVEPFIHCLEAGGAETGGGTRLVERGRLSSGGELLTLPHNPKNGRSWVVPHFHDLDADGDLDFLPSFMDGPYARSIALFENTTRRGEPLTFADRGPLRTVSGAPLAGGEAAGGWFPSVVFARDLDGDGDGRLDALVGTNNRCYFCRGVEPDGTGRWRAAEPAAVRAGGEEIVLFNPCFELADGDQDGDLDLFAAPQSGEILYYESRGERGPGGVPSFARGVALFGEDETYVQRSTHPRVTAADFTGDGLVDLLVDRAWELADLGRLSDERAWALLLVNTGTGPAPRWRRTAAAEAAGAAAAAEAAGAAASPASPEALASVRYAPYTASHPICDALRQSVVRAADWDGDGATDLLAGDCDGFLWWFRNEGSHLRPLFAPGRRLRAGGGFLSVAASGGHARHDLADWNGDGRKDLVVADGSGRVHVFLDEARTGEPVLGPARTLEALTEAGELRPLARGSRSHVLACDWNADGRVDLVVSDQENPGFHVLTSAAPEGAGSDPPAGLRPEPCLGPPRSLGLDPYVRPNLGAFVDWDGDGRKDLIACEFEHSIRLYRNTGSGAPGTEPVFAAPAGVALVKPPSIMMVSGADAIDWNRDGDLDLITGQGHGGSGIRFYERDSIEDGLRGTRPLVKVERFEAARPSLLEVVRGYADAMLEHGRDTYGPEQSGLFLSALDRKALRVLEARPAPPGGVRREDRAGLPWLPLTGANPQLDENLLRLLYSLSEITGDERYRAAADHEIEWFFKNTQSEATGLLPWGEHLAWDVLLDRPISGSTEFTHEFARPWVLWERTFALAPEAARRFALGLWDHQIADQRSGAFDRHAPYDRHGPQDGKDFPRHAGFYIDTWAHAWRHTRDSTFLQAIEVLLARHERKRARGPGGAPQATLGPLDIALAAALVPEPLASRLSRFAAEEDALIIEDLRREHAAGGAFAFEPTWQAGYSSGVTASWALFALARLETAAKPELRDLVIAVADAYVDALPAEDTDVWPMSFAHVIAAQSGAYRLTGSRVYLEEALRFARLAVELYWQDRPLPRASLKTDHYETITGADSLALALLEAHALASGLAIPVPLNSIDR
jgi:hypothetical protein